MRTSGTRRLLRPPYRRPVLTAGFTLLVYIILMVLSDGFAPGNIQTGIDMIACFIGIIFWMFFFAQFALPLYKVSDRVNAFYRLLFYVLGMAGPSIRIENGVIRERKDESLRNGPGVIILDTASGAVIRNPVEFKRAIGPGVSFTERFERIAGVVDLHLQRERLGPLENENPFEPKRADETDATYHARQERRFATQGLTRDGIEVAPCITIAVKLDAQPNEGNSGFGFNTEAVERAVKGRPIDLAEPNNTANREVDITWMPLRLAADIWKESLSRFTLEELFTYEPGKTTALQIILQELKNRLTLERFTEMDAFGRPGGIERECMEYKMLLSRGVRVVTVNVQYLKLPEKVEDLLVQLWKSSWTIQAQREQEYVEQQRSYEVDRGKRSALPLYARRVSHYLGAERPVAPPDGDHILQQLLRGTLYLTTHESYLHRRATDEIDQLKELLEWSEGKQGL